MIPDIKEFYFYGRNHTCLLKRGLVSANDLAVSAFALQTDRTQKITFDAGVDLSKYVVGAWVIIRGATQSSNNGKFKIAAVDNTNDFLYIINPEGVDESGSSATLIAKDLLHEATYVPGEVMKSVDDVTWAIKYDAEGYFHYQMLQEKDYVIVQITCETAGCDYHVEVSVDGFNYVDLPDPIDDTLVADNSVMVMIDQVCFGMHIRVHVDNLDADCEYYINAL